MNPVRLGEMCEAWRHSLKYSIRTFMANAGTPQAPLQHNCSEHGGIPPLATERHARRARELEMRIEKMRAEYWQGPRNA